VCADGGGRGRGNNKAHIAHQREVRSLPFPFFGIF